MKYIFILLAIASQSSFADNQKCEGKPLTFKSYFQIFDNVTANQDVDISDEGDYILVTSKSSKFYAFTKDSNPAHPSYLTFKIGFKGDQLFLDTNGAHSQNCEAYKQFKTKVSTVMDEYFKNIIPSTGK